MLGMQDKMAGSNKSCINHRCDASTQVPCLSEVPSISSQVCTKCKIEKDSSQFHRNTLTASGLVSRCKQCIAEADAKRCASSHSAVFCSDLPLYQHRHAGAHVAIQSVRILCRLVSAAGHLRSRCADRMFVPVSA